MLDLCQGFKNIRSHVNESIIFPVAKPSFLPHWMMLVSCDHKRTSYDTNNRIVKQDTIDSRFERASYYRAFYESFRQDFGDRCFSYLSIPLFSKDKSILIIEMKEYCGRVHAYGIVLVFKLDDGEYKFLTGQYTFES